MTDTTGASAAPQEEDLFANAQAPAQGQPPGAAPQSPLPPLHADLHDPRGMGMEPIIEIPDATLALAVAGSSGGHMGGVIACAYAGELHVGSKKIDIWGYGGAKSVETLNAFGICRALDEVYAEREGDDLHVCVLALKVGFMRFVKTHVPEWERNGGRNPQGEVPDAYDEWRRLWQMANIGKLSVDLATPGQFGLKRLQTKAKELAEIAHWKGAFNTAIIMSCGTNFETAK